MEARSASSFRRGSGRRVAAAAAAGVSLLALSWALLHQGFYDATQIVDTPVYRGYGEAMAAGRVPYRDFELEYPPGSLVVFALPSLLGDDYDSMFDLVMLVCALATVVFVALVLGELCAATSRLATGVAFVALAPLAVGSLLLTRFDLWPAALTAGALAALVSGRHRLALGTLALAAGAKLYALVLFPLAIVYVARRRGKRQAALAAALFAAVLGVVFLPFVATAPEGVLASFERQAGRPLQIESLGASLLLAAHRLGLYDAEVVSSHGSQNLAGELPDALATGQTALQVAAIAAVWLAFARARGDAGQLVTASAAAVAAFVVWGKVLSPQFLVWLLPLVPLVGGGAGLAAAGLLGATLVLTQLWFPFRYWDVVALESPIWLVLARNVLLVALFAVLLGAMRDRRNVARRRGALVVPRRTGSARASRVR